MQLNFIKLGAILLLISPLSANQVPANQVQGDLVHDFVDSPIKAVQAMTPWKFMEEMFIARPDAKKKLFAVNKSILAKASGNVVGGAVGGCAALSVVAGLGACTYTFKKKKDRSENWNWGDDNAFIGGGAIGVSAAVIASVLTSFVGYKVAKYIWNKHVDFVTFKSFIEQWQSNKIATPECFHQSFDVVYDQYMKLKVVNSKKFEDKVDTSKMTESQLKKHEKKRVRNQTKLDNDQLKLNISKIDKYFAALAPKVFDKIRQSIYAEFPKAYGDRLKAKSDIAENGSMYWQRVRPSSKVVKLVAGTALVAAPILIAASGVLAMVAANQVGGGNIEFGNFTNAKFPFSDFNRY